jgi:hypothetical protein
VLTGQSATSAIGSVSATYAVTLTGQSATGAAGTLTALAPSGATLTGLSATGDVGTLTPSGSTYLVALTSVVATASLGSLTALQIRPDPNPPINWGPVPGNANGFALDAAVQPLQARVTLTPAPQDANRNPLGPQPGPTE